MSKAFYPTNDGHIGNLRKFSMVEIRDLIQRQEDLLMRKQSILSKLLDKGARIKERLQDLKQELTRRETESSTETTSQQVESQQSLKHDSIQMDNQPNINDTENIKSFKVEEEKPKDKILEDKFQKLSLSASSRIDKHENDTSELVVTEKQKHQYEMALERAEKNLQSGLKKPIKLNRALKVEHIKDLPDEIIKMKDSMNIPEKKKPHETKMECTNVKANDESSAVPPNYKFSEVKMIDINESLQLQQQQKQVQEELNAELAAAKLAERLNIKMEVYNPEGVDMSYRNSRSGLEDIMDSDDDEDEDIETAGYSKTLVPSDTED